MSWRQSFGGLHAPSKPVCCVDLLNPPWFGRGSLRPMIRSMIWCARHGLSWPDPSHAHASPIIC